MGSGLGANQVNSGDYNNQLFDEAAVEQFGLGNLRLGDKLCYGRVTVQALQQ